MPSKSELAGLLADRIDRLRGALAALRRSVRDRVAEVVGAAVADAVRDTVRIAPDPPAPALPAAPAARCEAYDPWGGPDPGDWADDDPICDREPDTWGYPRPADAGGTAEPAATPARAGGPERADLAGAAGRPVAPGACGCRRGQGPGHRHRRGAADRGMRGTDQPSGWPGPTAGASGWRC